MENAVKSLIQKKTDLKETWENCFEMKIEDKINENGLTFFWSADTSLEEAAELLDIAAIDLALDSLVSDGAIAMVLNVSKKNKPEPCKGEECKKVDKFRVARISPDTHMYETKFYNPDEAEAFITEVCLNSKYKRDDFTILQEMN